MSSGFAEAKTAISWTTWLGGDQLSVLAARIEEFERLNPDIDVEILSFPGSYDDYKARLLSMAAAGTWPDVAHITIYDADFLIANDLLYDVTRYASSINRDDYFISDAMVRDGRVYGGFESHVQVYPIYYDVDAFNRAGLATPNELAASGAWTWEVFREVAKSLTVINSQGDVQRYGVMLHPWWEVGWGPFTVSNGASFINEDYTEVTIDSPPSVEALEFFADLYLVDRVAPIPGTPLPSGDALLTGAAAMVLTGSWAMNYYKQFAGEIVNWDIAPTPIGASEQVYRAPGVDGVVLAGTNHPDEAWRLVEFFLGEYVQLDKAQSKLEVPVLKTAVSSDIYQQAPPANMMVIADLLNRSIVQPTFLGSLEVRSVIEQALIPAFRGDIPLSEGIIQAKNLGQAKLDEFLASARN